MHSASREAVTVPGDARGAPLIGAFVPEIRALAVRGIFWGVLYGVVSQAARGECGALVDGVVDPSTPAAEHVCVQATLGPSPLVWLAMAVVFVVGLGRAGRADSTQAITRILSRTAIAMPLLALAGYALAMWWFVTAPADVLFAGTAPPWVDLRLMLES